MLLESARTAGVMVIHVQSEGDSLAASDVGLARSSLREGLPCDPGSWGARFAEGVVPHDNEPIVLKRRLSPFPDSRLELLLRSNQIRTVIIAGVETHLGIESTARDASNRDFYVIVPRDAVASRKRAHHLHEAALEVVSEAFGEVIACSDLRRAWSEPPPPVRPTVGSSGDVKSRVPLGTKS